MSYEVSSSCCQLMLCDDNGPFLRKYIRSCTQGGAVTTTPSDFLLDGVTPYTVVGTIRACAEVVNQFEGLQPNPLCDLTTGAIIGYAAIIRTEDNPQVTSTLYFDTTFQPLQAQPANSGPCPNYDIIGEIGCYYPLIDPAPTFFPDFPANAATWEYSGNSGVSWSSPAPISTNHTAGTPAGLRRWRTTFTIPQDLIYGGKIGYHVFGDIYDGGQPGSAGSLYIDGNFVATTGTTGDHISFLDLTEYGPGEHVFEWREGPSGIDGATIPNFNLDFSQALGEPYAVEVIKTVNDDGSIDTILVYDGDGSLITRVANDKLIPGNCPIDTASGGCPPPIVMCDKHDGSFTSFLRIFDCEDPTQVTNIDFDGNDYVIQGTIVPGQCEACCRDEQTRTYQRVEINHITTTQPGGMQFQTFIEGVLCGTNSIVCVGNNEPGTNVYGYTVNNDGLQTIIFSSPVNVRMGFNSYDGAASETLVFSTIKPNRIYPGAGSSIASQAAWDGLSLPITWHNSNNAAFTYFEWDNVTQIEFTSNNQVGFNSSGYIEWVEFLSMDAPVDGCIESTPEDCDDVEVTCYQEGSLATFDANATLSVPNNYRADYNRTISSFVSGVGLEINIHRLDDTITFANAGGNQLLITGSGTIQLSFNRPISSDIVFGFRWSDIDGDETLASSYVPHEIVTGTGVIDWYWNSPDFCELQNMTVEVDGGADGVILSFPYNIVVGPVARTAISYFDCNRNEVARKDGMSGLDVPLHWRLVPCNEFDLDCAGCGNKTPIKTCYLTNRDQMSANFEWEVLTTTTARNTFVTTVNGVTVSYFVTLTGDLEFDGPLGVKPPGTVNLPVIGTSGQVLYKLESDVNLCNVCYFDLGSFIAPQDDVSISPTPDVITPVGSVLQVTYNDSSVLQNGIVITVNATDGLSIPPVQTSICDLKEILIFHDCNQNRTYVDLETGDPVTDPNLISCPQELCDNATPVKVCYLDPDASEVVSSIDNYEWEYVSAYTYRLTMYSRYHHKKIAFEINVGSPLTFTGRMTSSGPEVDCSGGPGTVTYTLRTGVELCNIMYIYLWGVNGDTFSVTSTPAPTQIIGSGSPSLIQWLTDVEKPQYNQPVVIEFTAFANDTFIASLPAIFICDQIKEALQFYDCGLNMVRFIDIETGNVLVDPQLISCEKEPLDDDCNTIDVREVCYEPIINELPSVNTTVDSDDGTWEKAQDSLSAVYTAPNIDGGEDLHLELIANDGLTLGPITSQYIDTVGVSGNIAIRVLPNSPAHLCDSNPTNPQPLVIRFDNYNGAPETIVPSPAPDSTSVVGLSITYTWDNYPDVLETGYLTFAISGSNGLTFSITQPFLEVGCDQRKALAFINCRGVITKFLDAITLQRIFPTGAIECDEGDTRQGELVCFEDSPYYNWAEWTTETAGSMIDGDTGETVAITINPAPGIGAGPGLTDPGLHPNFPFLDSDGNAANPAPNTQWGAGATSQINFDRPVKNPVFWVNSLGGSNPITLTFDRDFVTLASSGVISINEAARTVYGDEGRAAIMFPGWHQNFSMVSNVAETFTYLTVGNADDIIAQGVRCVSCDGTVKVINPATGDIISDPVITQCGVIRALQWDLDGTVWRPSDLPANAKVIALSYTVITNDATNQVVDVLGNTITDIPTSFSGSWSSEAPDVFVEPPIEIDSGATGRIIVQATVVV